MCVYFFSSSLHKRTRELVVPLRCNKWLWVASRALQDASWILESYLWYWYMFLLCLFVYAHVIEISDTKGHQSLSLIRLVQFSASFEQGSMTINRDGFRNIMQRNLIFDSFKAPQPVHPQSPLFSERVFFHWPNDSSRPSHFLGWYLHLTRKTESILPHLLEELFNVYV